MSGDSLEAASERLVAKAQLVLVAMFTVTVVFMVAESLLGQLPAAAASVVAGIAFLFLDDVGMTVDELLDRGSDRGR